MLKPGRPGACSPLQSKMNIIRTLLDRLSDSLFITAPEKIGLVRGLSSTPSLRLVSDKSAATPVVDPTLRRATTQVGIQLDALEDAVKRSQGWFLCRQHPSEGYW